ncbi:MAG TPA: serine acetyltransferase [Syntrophus sp. (in: bacteria)]|nr:serine acetyltransferase [Syntrophus sp. (in: bacteria)]
MNLSLPRPELATYLGRQLEAFFPDGAPPDGLEAGIGEALARLETCFAHVADPAFSREGRPYFNHLHSDQYAMFVYLISRVLYERGADRRTCEKLFCLNKALYGIDAFFEVELPAVFVFSHATGTVLGRATYGDFLLVYQHCTVGAARAAKGGGRGLYPVLGSHVSLYAGATVVGACRIGDMCKISAHSLILNRHLKPGLMYRGTPASHETAPFPFPDNIWRSP